MNRFLTRSVSLAALVLASASAHAAPVQWTTASGGNGHWYEYVSLPGGSWEDSLAAAAGSTFNGMQGYLATITSAGENDFLYSSVTGGAGWVSGADHTTEGTWVWSAGPEAGTVFWKDGITQTYAAWNGAEPNNSGDEDYVVIKQLPGWNDAPTSYAQAYYVEYSAAAAVPEPETYTLLLAGLGMVGYMSQRRKAR